MAKQMQSIEWHEACLKNMETLVPQQEQALLRAAEDLGRLKYQIRDIHNRIAKAKAAGKTQMEVK